MKHLQNGAAIFGAAPFFCLNRPEIKKNVIFF